MSGSAPKYRLQPVLDKKQKVKDEAQEALAKVQAELRDEEERKTALEAELEKLKQDRAEARRRQQEEMLTKGMSGMGAGRIQSFVKGQESREEQKREEILEQETVIEKVRFKLEEQKLILTEAAREVQGMEKHRDEWLAKIRKEAEEKEAKEMDEIGTAIHLQRQRREEG